MGEESMLHETIRRRKWQLQPRPHRLTGAGAISLAEGLILQFSSCTQRGVLNREVVMIPPSPALL